MTYAQLLAALQNITADNDTEYVTEIPFIIARAERRLLRDLDLELFEDLDDSLSTVIDGTTLTLPKTVVMVTSAWITVAGALEFLEERGLDYCRAYSPDASATGTPKYYAELLSDAADQANMLYFAPTPAAVAALSLKVIRRPAGLSVSVTETWLSRHADAALTQAALIEAWQFLKNPVRIDEAANLYSSLLPQAKQEVGKLSRRTYAGVGARPKPQPTEV